MKFLITLDGKPVGKPYFDIDEAKKLVVEHMEVDREANIQIDVYPDGLAPMTALRYNPRTKEWRTLVLPV